MQHNNSVQEGTVKNSEKNYKTKYQVIRNSKVWQYGGYDNKYFEKDVVIILHVYLTWLKDDQIAGKTLFWVCL